MAQLHFGWQPSISAENQHQKIWLESEDQGPFVLLKPPVTHQPLLAPSWSHSRPEPWDRPVMWPCSINSRGSTQKEPDRLLSPELEPSLPTTDLYFCYIEFFWSKIINPLLFKWHTLFPRVFDPRLTLKTQVFRIVALQRLPIPPASSPGLVSGAQSPLSNCRLPDDP